MLKLKIIYVILIFCWTFTYVCSRSNIEKTQTTLPDHTFDETGMYFIKSRISNLTEVLKQTFRNLKQSLKNSIENVTWTAVNKQISNSKKFRPSKEHVPSVVSPVTTGIPYVSSSTSTEPPRIPCGNHYSQIPPHVAEFLGNSTEILCKSSTTSATKFEIQPNSELPKTSSEESQTFEVPSTLFEELHVSSDASNESSSIPNTIENTTSNDTNANWNITSEKIPFVFEKVNFTSYNDWKTSDFLISFKIAHENYIATSTTPIKLSSNPLNSTVSSRLRFFDKLGNLTRT